MEGISLSGAVVCKMAPPEIRSLSQFFPFFSSPFSAHSSQNFLTIKSEEFGFIGGGGGGALCSSSRGCLFCGPCFAGVILLVDVSEVDASSPGYSPSLPFYGSIALMNTISALIHLEAPAPGEWAFRVLPPRTWPDPLPFLTPDKARTSAPENSREIGWVSAGTAIITRRERRKLKFLVAAWSFDYPHKESSPFCRFYLRKKNNTCFREDRHRGTWMDGYSPCGQPQRVPKASDAESALWMGLPLIK